MPKKSVSKKPDEIDMTLNYQKYQIEKEENLKLLREKVEMEQKDLIFKPKINKKSKKMVEDKKERIKDVA
jgi:hypothetical protein